jgi:hypothetical protein
MKKRKPAKLQIVGLTLFPAEIEAKVKSLDAAINALRSDVETTPVKGSLDAGWRIEFDAFCRRWQVARDEYDTFASRVFATGAELDAFEESYQFWARDFQRKGGKVSFVPIKATPPEKPQDVIDAAGKALSPPDQFWWILAGGVALWIVVNRPRS